MAEFLCGLSLFPLVLTFGAYQLALWIQKKGKSPILNPILVSSVLVILFLLVTGIPNETFQAGNKSLTWLLTPATVCLALPLYKQLQTLKKSLPAILVGIAAGTVVSLLFIFGLCWLFKLDRAMTVSLLPKSITTAMGMVLSENAGGYGSLTAAAIIITGIQGSLMGTMLCKLFKITDPVAQGVAFGTASHVVGTSKATELGQLQGAVSSLSLAVAGILTAVIFPLALMLVA